MDVYAKIQRTLEPIERNCFKREQRKSCTHVPHRPHHIPAGHPCSLKPNPGWNPGLHCLWLAGYRLHSGVKVGWYPGWRPGCAVVCEGHSRVAPGVAPGMQPRVTTPGYTPGATPGCNPGLHPGLHPGCNPGLQPRVRPQEQAGVATPGCTPD